MLLMHTNYDPVAAVLSGWATQFQNTYPQLVTATLPPNGAGWNNPVGWLQGHRSGTTLLFFGHGLTPPPALESQSQLPFASGVAATALRHRFVAGVCCFGAEVGAVQWATETTIVGYRNRLKVITRPKYAALLGQCVMAGLDVVANGGTAQEVYDATRIAFETTASNLQNSPNATATDMVYAPEFLANAHALVIVGDPNRRP